MTDAQLLDLLTRTRWAYEQRQSPDARAYDELSPDWQAEQRKRTERFLRDYPWVRELPLAWARGILGEEDARLVGTLIEHAISPDPYVYLGPNGEEIDAPEIIAARDLGRRICEAIGQPATDSERATGDPTM